MIPLTDKQALVIISKLCACDFQQLWESDRTTDICVFEHDGMPVNAFHFPITNLVFLDYQIWKPTFHIKVDGFDFITKFEQKDSYSPWCLDSADYTFPDDIEVRKALLKSLDKVFNPQDTYEWSNYYRPNRKFENEWEKEQIVENIKRQLKHETYLKIGSCVYPYNTNIVENLIDIYHGVGIARVAAESPMLTKEAAAIELAKNV